MKLANLVVTDEMYDFRLFEAVKRGLGELKYENIHVYTNYEIDFFREMIEVEVLLKDGERLRHIERIDVQDLLGDVNGPMLCMIAEFEAAFHTKSRRKLMEHNVVKLNHVRFLSDDKPVCHWPARLGTDIVYNTHRKKDEQGCKECSQLLVAHNVREQEKDNERKIMPQYVSFQPDQISPVKVLFLIAFIVMMIAVVLGLILIAH